MADRQKRPQTPVPGLLSNASGPGNFYREYIVRIDRTGRGVCSCRIRPNSSLTGHPCPGLIAGQYRLPIFEYIFGEGTIFGEPIPPFNLQ